MVQGDLVLGVLGRASHLLLLRGARPRGGLEDKARLCRYTCARKVAGHPSVTARAGPTRRCGDSKRLT